MKIYTKTGDKGMSSLYNGTRKCKNSIIFKFLGDFDELNCHLGMVKAFHSDEIGLHDIKIYTSPSDIFYKDKVVINSDKYYEWFSLKDYIHKIQINIMDISAFIATPPYNNKVRGDMLEHLEKWILKVGFSEDHSIELEKQIDRLDSILPPLKNFVVPSGNKLISQIHIARAITRRCERTFIDLYKTEYYEYVGVYEMIDIQINNVRLYLNRLSDYLFMLARFVGMSLDIQEDLYIK